MSADTVRESADALRRAARAGRARIPAITPGRVLAIAMIGVGIAVLASQIPEIRRELHILRM